MVLCKTITHWHPEFIVFVVEANPIGCSLVFIDRVQLSYWALALIFRKGGNPKRFLALFCFEEGWGNCHILFLDVSLTWSFRLGNSSICFKFLFQRKTKACSSIMKMRFKHVKCWFTKWCWSHKMYEAICWHVSQLTFFIICLACFCFPPILPVSNLVFSQVLQFHIVLVDVVCSHLLQRYRKRQCYPLLVLN